MAESIIDGLIRSAVLFLVWILIIAGVATWAYRSSERSSRKWLVVFLALVSIPGIALLKSEGDHHARVRASDPSKKTSREAVAAYQTLCKQVGAGKILVSESFKMSGPVDVQLQLSSYEISNGPSDKSGCFFDGGRTGCLPLNVANIQWTQRPSGLGCERNRETSACADKHFRWNRQQRAIHSQALMTAPYLLRMDPATDVFGGHVDKQAYKLLDSRTSKVLAEAEVYSKKRLEMIDGVREPPYCPDLDQLLVRMVESVFPMPEKPQANVPGKTPAAK